MQHLVSSLLLGVTIPDAASIQEKLLIRRFRVHFFAGIEKTVKVSRLPKSLKYKSENFRHPRLHNSVLAFNLHLT